MVATDAPVSRAMHTHRPGPARCDRPLAPRRQAPAAKNCPREQRRGRAARIFIADNTSSALLGRDAKREDRTTSENGHANSLFARANSLFARPNLLFARPNSLFARPNLLFARPNSVFARPNSLLARANSLSTRTNSLSARSNSESARHDSHAALRTHRPRREAGAVVVALRAESHSGVAMLATASNVEGPRRRCAEK